MFQTAKVTDNGTIRYSIYTITYSPPIATISLYIAPFLRHIGWKSPLLTYPISIWRPRWDVPFGISSRFLTSEN